MSPLTDRQRRSLDRRTHAAGSAQRQAGFTLIELLVAVTLLAIMGALLFSNFSFGVTVWERGRAQVAATEEVSAVRRFLKDQLERAYPYRTTNETDDAPAFFQGEAEEVVFVSPLPAYLGRGQLHVVTVGFERYAGSLLGDLVAAWEPVIAGSGLGSREERRRVLMTDVRGVRFAYEDASGGRRPESWPSTWSPALRLPRRIALEVTFPEGDPRHWTEFVATPMSDMDARCQARAGSTDCNRGGVRPGLRRQFNSPSTDR